MRQRIPFVFAVLAAFFIGVVIGYLPLRSRLAQCETDKARLATDLNRAVARGVAVETQLNLSKGEKK